MASAPGAPPGSRVTTMLARALSFCARARASVDFPVPAPPSRVMKRPCAMPSMCAREGDAQALPSLRKPIGAANALACHQREPRRLIARAFDDELGHHLPLR